MTGAPTAGGAGLWVAAIGDWNLKIRVNWPAARDAAWGRALAETAARSVAADTAVARACAVKPPERQVIDFPIPPEVAANGGPGAFNTTASTVAAGVLLQGGLLPADLHAARDAGFVCLEEVQAYPARVLRRREDAVLSETERATRMRVLFRAEPLSFGPAIWAALLPDAAEELATGRPAIGRVIAAISREQDAVTLWGLVQDEASLPGFAVAVEQGTIPQVARISVN